MKARFQDRLAVRLEIAPEAREVLVPHLLLQPLVENSIRHCMDDLSRTGEITISASREGERLRLGVQDSGPAPIPHHPTVVFVSTYDEYAVSAFEVEAVDYMLKPFTESRFHQASQRVRETLDRLESRLDPERFARIHRSTIVTIGHVRELRPHLHGDYEVVLIDGTSIRLGRPYRERLIKDHDGA